MSLKVFFLNTGENIKGIEGFELFFSFIKRKKQIYIYIYIKIVFRNSSIFDREVENMIKKESCKNSGANLKGRDSNEIYIFLVF